MKQIFSKPVPVCQKDGEILGRVEKYHSVVGSTSTIDIYIYSYELVDNAVIQHVDVDHAAYS